MTPSRPASASALAVLLVAAATARAAEPVQTVSAIRAPSLEWRPHLDAVGNLRAIRGADMSSEVAGIVDQIRFMSGEDVHAGDILVELRLNDEPGRLDAARAAADLAAINLARDQRQFAAQAVSRAVIDADKSTLDQDRAQVVQDQALIAEKIVRAPFDGRLGVRLIDPGQYLAPGTAMVTLQTLDPIYMDFYVPQGSIDAIRVGDQASVMVDSYGTRRFPARILAITPRVDQASRTVLVRATLANHDHALLPGMFANIRIENETGGRRYVTIPQAAVSFTTYGDTVFVVRKDAHGTLVAHQVLVRTGDTRGDQVAILSGLSPGDRVVTAGQIKLHDGTPVAINDQIMPSDASAPSLAEE